MTDLEETSSSRTRPIIKGLWLIFAPILAVGAIAFAAGLIAGASEADGPHGVGFYIALAIALAIIGGCVWLTLRILPAYRLPRSPRMRQGRVMLYASGLMGVVVGAATILFQRDDPQGMIDIVTGVEPMPRALALLLLAGMAITTALSVRWHRLLDEHERAAYDFGAVAAIYVYFAVSVGWWLLWRAQLAPGVNAFAIFWVTMATWVLGWLIRRYR